MVPSYVNAGPYCERDQRSVQDLVFDVLPDVREMKNVASGDFKGARFIEIAFIREKEVLLFAIPRTNREVLERVNQVRTMAKRVRARIDAARFVDGLPEVVHSLLVTINATLERCDETKEKLASLAPALLEWPRWASTLLDKLVLGDPVSVGEEALRTTTLLMDWRVHDFKEAGLILEPS